MRNHAQTNIKVLGETMQSATFGQLAIRASHYSVLISIGGNNSGSVWGKSALAGAHSNKGITYLNVCRRRSKRACELRSAPRGRNAMSLRLARLVFGPMPVGEVEFGEGSVTTPVRIPAPESSLLSRIRRNLTSDETLAVDLQSGDADALTVLFERHGSRLFGVARRILRNEAEAEDAVQQTFLDVFRSIQQFDPEKGTFKKWLFMFGYQRIFNCRRSLTANRFFETDQFDELLPGLNRDAGRSSSSSLAETAVLIDQMLSNLHPRQRRTIELVYYEGLTAEEISLRTGETVRVVRHNLYRGLEKLRKAICGCPPLSGNASKGGVR
jgi:RNA polymerase sigma-70 factor, ECF subfamily